MKNNKIYGERTLLRKLGNELVGIYSWELAKLLASSVTPNLANEGFDAPFTVIPVEGNLPNTYILVGSTGQQRTFHTAVPDDEFEKFICTLSTESASVNGCLKCEDYVKLARTGELVISKRELSFPSAKLSLSFEEGGLAVQWEFNCNSEELHIDYLIPKTEKTVSYILETSSAVYEKIFAMHKENVVKIFELFSLQFKDISTFVAEYLSSAGNVLHSLVARQMQIVAYTKTVDSSAVWEAASLIIDGDTEIGEEDKEKRKALLPKKDKVTYTVKEKNWMYESKKLCFSFDNKTKAIDFKSPIHEASLKLLTETVKAAKKEAFELYHELPVKWKS